MKNVRGLISMFRWYKAQGFTSEHSIRTVRMFAHFLTHLAYPLHAMQGNSKGMVSTSTVPLVPIPMTGPYLVELRTVYVAGCFARAHVN